MEIRPLVTLRFVRAHGLDELSRQFAIVIKRHPRWQHLVSLKYDQLNSPMNEPIVQECRGLLLDLSSDWQVVACPFFKFFNYREPFAAPVDWSSSRVYEKLDGAIMTLYWYSGEWQVAGNGAPDGGGALPGYRGSFADLFWQTWQQSNYQLPANRTQCYMFELMTKYNRVVVRHPRSRLVLLGARSLHSYAELDPIAVADTYGWNVAPYYTFSSISEVVDSCESMDPTRQEGYVVCDSSFRRVKVKAPQYVALSLSRESVTRQRLIEVMRRNESGEFLSYFPEWREELSDVGRQFEQLCEELERNWRALEHVGSPKDFAELAATSRCPSALQAVRRGKATSIRDFLVRCSITRLTEMMDAVAEER